MFPVVAGGVLPAAMNIESIPSEENPRTGKLTALSVIACLRGLVEPLRVGT
jgi:aspartate dehydrogenase